MEGKAKEDFEKWLISQQFLVCDGDEGGSCTIYLETPSIFETLPPSMQFGVIQDFFDSVGINTEIIGRLPFIWAKVITDNPKDFFESDTFKTRSEAREAALEKAVEIYNETK